MKPRAIQTAKTLIPAALVGMGYVFLLLFTPFSIPCPFHAVTGWYCPGCGVSRMCLSLLQLDFAAALRSNAALILLLPVALFLFIFQTVRYIRTGQRSLSRWQTVLIWSATVLLLAFGILRNFPAFAFLAPH